MRLRRSDCEEPGIRRRRNGRGFVYVDAEGERVSAEERARIESLAIPPAWDDVWICADERGHIQATGVDAAGRTQYRYHDRWRERADERKFDDMIVFARSLPALRAAVERDLRRRKPSRELALALAIRLLDRGFFRIGSEQYAAENDSYGLATLRREHIKLWDDTLLFDFPAKSGQRRRQFVTDPQAARAAKRLLARRGGGEEFLAYKERGRWRDLKSADINERLRELSGGELSAKDFRTWHATVLAAIGLAVTMKPNSDAALRRAEKRVVEEVARHLGNTPAVARRSYIDPRVFAAFERGRKITLPADFGDARADQAVIERRVLALLA